jgi:hypothetical protein
MGLQKHQDGRGEAFFGCIYLGGGLSVRGWASYSSFFFSMAVLLFIIHDELQYFYSEGCVTAVTGLEESSE